jgi:hypothetical protein
MATTWTKETDPVTDWKPMDGVVGVSLEYDDDVDTYDSEGSYDGDGGTAWSDVSDPITVWTKVGDP